MRKQTNVRRYDGAPKVKFLYYAQTREKDRVRWTIQLSSTSHSRWTHRQAKAINPRPLKRRNRIEIDVQDVIKAVKFLPDGKHVVSAGEDEKIRRWRVADGSLREVGKPMDAGSTVRDVAVSRDGKWIVAGSKDGRVTVWNATDHEMETNFQTSIRSGYLARLDENLNAVNV